MSDSDQLVEIMSEILGSSKLWQFRGVYAQDELMSLDPFPVPWGAIVHSRKKQIKSGHWFAIFVSRRRTGHFFCSYGLMPFGASAKLLEQNSVYTIYNTKLIQSLTSTMCGSHCVFVLANLMAGKQFDAILKTFGPVPIKNDAFVADWISKRCGKSRNFSFSD